jgi:hypothetical protein
MKHFLLSAVIVIGLLFAVSLVSAQSADLELVWSAIDSGGTTFSTAGALELSGTIGQPEAGTISSENLVIWGGFWGATGTTNPSGNAVFIPLLLQNR